MKLYGGVDVKLHMFLTSISVSGQLHDSEFLNPGEDLPMSMYKELDAP